MASVPYSTLRRGAHIVRDGQLYQVVDHELRTPGNLPSKLRIWLKNRRTGAVTDYRVHPEDRVEDASSPGNPGGGHFSMTPVAPLRTLARVSTSVRRANFSGAELKPSRCLARFQQIVQAEDLALVDAGLCFGVGSVEEVLLSGEGRRNDAPHTTQRLVLLVVGNLLRR
ncbi:hypothetical protein J8F10_19925 [Gemmata sp. G18]|uniref:Translation elongation factor KOW-like domain-containing protein n=1 Tax=Gemmata palustris TaxID=2822762 RepID=A0ABS5BVS1_9BACT|nr:hypothetical protein [Gemmata palustris]MBP3957522.1 hypothetical protein [Gemmata palustris]